MNQPKRSDEPIWWALFSAGGVCFAVVIPGLLLTIALLYPLGVLPEKALNYHQVQQWLLQDWWGLAGLALAGAAICLPLFHAMHRIHHGLHDLKLSSGLLGKILCYSSASLFSALALYFWWQGLG
jgi:fumarate reductase subunit D